MKQALKDSGAEFKSLNAEFRTLNGAHVKSGTQVTHLQKQVHDLEQKALADGTALQNQVQQLTLQSTGAVAGEHAIANQLVQLKEQNANLLAQIQKGTEMSSVAEGLLIKAKEDCERLTIKHSATQKSLESAKAEKLEFQKEKDEQVSVSKRAAKAAKKMRRSLEKENAEMVREITDLKSQLARLTRRSTKKLEYSKTKYMEQLSDLKKKLEENTDLKAASVTQSGRYTELHTKYKKSKDDVKRLTADLRDRQVLDQVVQEKIKYSESRIKNAEDSASKHKIRALELARRLELAQGGFRQQDAKFASPPTNRGGRDYRYSPLPMSSLTADDDTRTASESKMVLKTMSTHKCPNNYNSVAPYMQAENKEVANFFEKNNMGTTRSISAPTT